MGYDDVSLDAFGLHRMDPVQSLGRPANSLRMVSHEKD
jgi:hypothetical protein